MYDLLNGEQVKLFRWYHFEPKPVIPNHYICSHGGNLESFTSGETIPYLTEQPYGITFLILDPNPTQEDALFLIHWIENKILKQTIVYQPTEEVNPHHIIWNDTNIFCQEICQLLSRDIPVFDINGKHKIKVHSIDEIITYTKALKHTKEWIDEQLVHYHTLRQKYFKEVKKLNQFQPDSEEFQTQLKEVDAAETLRQAEYHRNQPGISAIKMIFDEKWHDPVTPYPYMHLVSQWLDALHLIIEDKNDNTYLINEYRKRFKETFPDFNEKDIELYKSYLSQVCHEPNPDTVNSDFNFIFHP